MGSASRTALAAGLRALDASAGVDLVAGQQLLAAARAIDESAQLRSLLSDPTLAAGDRIAIVGRVFGSFGGAARGLLDGLAASRWSSPAELVDGVEEVGVRAIARSTDADVTGELFAVERAVSSEAELELALGSKLSAPEARAAVVTRLLSGKASPATLAIVRHLVLSPRGRRIGGMLRHAAEGVADVGGSVVATVTVAAPLNTQQESQLIADLTARLGRPPRIQYLQDPAVLGGVRVRTGDIVIDGTVASRLAALRLQLAG